MIDIHNHMLPAVDDGAKSDDIALDMLNDAVAQGVEHLVLTPHLYEADIIKGTGAWKARVDQGSESLLGLIKANNIPIQVTVAAEVRYQDLIPVILDELDVLIGGKYMLLEFSFHSVPNNLERIIYDITRKGITPIIAHPERIKPWQHEPKRLEELINMGCPTQVDIGSLLGTLGSGAEKLANFLLERDAVHILGSDSHNMESRKLYTKPGYDWITERYDSQYADLLLIDNPRKIISGEPVAVYPVDLTPPRSNWRDKLLSILKP